MLGQPLGPGSDPLLKHGVEALEDTLEYDVFNPPRQDWIDPESGFLRG